MSLGKRNNILNNLSGIEARGGCNCGAICAARCNCKCSGHGISGWFVSDSNHDGVGIGHYPAEDVRSPGPMVE